MFTDFFDETAINRAIGLIGHAHRILIVSHMTPDGDAVGSSLAASHVLKALGKEVKVMVPDAIQMQLRKLPGARNIFEASSNFGYAFKIFERTDLVLCLDFNTPSRISRLEPALRACKAPKILIDHHLFPDVEADVQFSFPELSSTCYLLFRLLRRMGYSDLINSETAECLLAGMMTDTGNFSYNCNDPEVFNAVAELVRKGADKEKLYRELFDTISADCMRLNAYAIYKKMEVFPEYGAALITLSRDELNRFHYSRGDTEGLVNRPLAIPGIEYSAFMREERDTIRVSMRSLGDFPVNEICTTYFQGGGHKNAAGGDFHGTIEQAADYFRSILEEIKERYLTDQSNSTPK